MSIVGANLGTMRESIKQWSQRKSIPDAVLNDFINIAVTRATRALRIPPMEKSLSQLVDADGYFEIPSDFIEVIEVVSVRSDKNIILERKAIHEVDYMNNLSPGCPKFFARYKGSFRIGPYDSPAYDVPEDQDVVELYYYATFAALTDDADCNWLISNAGDMILYGAMSELASYTRDDEGEQRWTAKYSQEVQLLQGIEDRSAWQGGTLGISIAGSH